MSPNPWTLRITRFLTCLVVALVACGLGYSAGIRDGFQRGWESGVKLEHGRAAFDQIPKRGAF